MFGLSELAIILIVVAVVVGVKKLPELTRSAGKSARILKAEARAMKESGPPGEPKVIRGEAIRKDAPGNGGG
ncbi:twin-arginine translocase TatA/TatE family subunit [Streptomyces sp. ISL-12]|uniref:twin-arginine translocase TatA/TatE family subunit n=1 Tax=Streptomyces sp. ISL-12 TaxID=2819177 RepID=UPI001BEA74F5|nr:twin-arginine translocase TatA/TatE family subunit [Streptomyces sp. ISL-12]MBT2412384.1 twin-arginine translocase TatA/TatE family subunit [Streptomyces sp. ISL-12]